MVYAIVFLILMLAGFYYYKRNSSSTFNAAIAFLFILFVYIAGMRYNLGVDYFVYQRAFIESDGIFDILDYRNYEHFKTYHSWELGFSLLMMTIKGFTDEPQWLFLISSIICTVLLFKSLLYFNPKKYFILGLATYFCSVYVLQEMQALRQALAAGFIFYGFTFYLRHQIRKSICWFIAAVLFHTSAIIFLIIIPLLNKRYSLVTQLTLVGLSLIVITFQIPWFATSMLAISAYLPGGESLSRVFSYFAEGELFFSRKLYFTYFLYLIVYLFMLYRYRNNCYYHENNKVAFAQNLLFGYLVVSGITWEVNYISTRLGWYMLFGAAIVFPRFLEIFNQRSRKLGYAYYIAFHFLLIRPFIFPTMTSAPFVPYEDYISCEFFGTQSTGKDRAERYEAEQRATVL